MDRPNQGESDSCNSSSSSSKKKKTKKKRSAAPSAAMGAHQPPLQDDFGSLSRGEITKTTKMRFLADKQGKSAKSAAASKRALTDDVAPENETQLERKRRLNRNNERRKRAKRIHKIEDLTAQYHGLVSENETLKSDKKTLQDQIAYVKQYIQDKDKKPAARDLHAAPLPGSTVGGVGVAAPASVPAFASLPSSIGTSESNSERFSSIPKDQLILLLREEFMKQDSLLHQIRSQCGSENSFSGRSGSSEAQVTSIPSQLSDSAQSLNSVASALSRTNVATSPASSSRTSSNPGSRRHVQNSLVSASRPAAEVLINAAAQPRQPQAASPIQQRNSTRASAVPASEAQNNANLQSQLVQALLSSVAKGQPRHVVQVPNMQAFGSDQQVGVQAPAQPFIAQAPPPAQAPISQSGFQILLAQGQDGNLTLPAQLQSQPQLIQALASHPGLQLQASLSQLQQVHSQRVQAVATNHGMQQSHASLNLLAQLQGGRQGYGVNQPAAVSVTTPVTWEAVAAALLGVNPSRSTDAALSASRSNMVPQQAQRPAAAPAVPSHQLLSQLQELLSSSSQGAVAHASASASNNRLSPEEYQILLALAAMSNQNQNDGTSFR